MRNFLFVFLMASLVKADDYNYDQKLKNAVFPGYQTDDVDDLNKNFKKKVDKVIEEMESLGYDVKIRSTYRSSDYQDFIYHISKATEKHLGKKITSVKGGESRHNKTKNGVPASCAVDIEPNDASKEKSMEFYKKLIAVSGKHGLRTGGQFKKSNPELAKYGLGWDPGHVYMKKC